MITDEMFHITITIIIVCGLSEQLHTLTGGRAYICACFLHVKNLFVALLNNTHHEEDHLQHSHSYTLTQISWVCARASAHAAMAAHPALMH